MLNIALITALLNLLGVQSADSVQNQGVATPETQIEENISI